MSEDKLQDDINRGQRATALLNDPLLKECIEGLIETYTRELFLTRPTEPQAREILYMAVNIAGKFRDHLASFASNGKLAQRELDMLIERKRVGRPPKAA